MYAAAVAADDRRPKIVLLGDSVLDNFAWLDRPRWHLTPQLQSRLGTDADDVGTDERDRYRVVNLAVDQHTTFDFPERRRATNDWARYDALRARLDCPSLPPYVVVAAADDDDVIDSYAALRRLGNVRYVVLSVGGNDVYLRRDVQATLVRAASAPWSRSAARDARRVVTEFGERYTAILRRVHTAAPHAVIVPVVCYHPHYDVSVFGGCGGGRGGGRGGLGHYLVTSMQKWMLGGVVAPLVREILRAAHRFQLPVIDLCRTFDPRNARHYGTGDAHTVNELGVAWSGVEPSNLSSGMIAALVARIVRLHDRAAVAAAAADTYAPDAESRVYWLASTTTNRRRRGGGDGDDALRSDRNTATYHTRYRFSPTWRQSPKYQ